MDCFVRDQQPLSKKGQKKQQKAEEKAKKKAETQARLVKTFKQMFFIRKLNKLHEYGFVFFLEAVQTSH